MLFWTQSFMVWTSVMAVCIALLFRSPDPPAALNALCLIQAVYKKPVQKRGSFFGPAVVLVIKSVI